MFLKTHDFFVFLQVNIFMPFECNISIEAYKATKTFKKLLLRIRLNFFPYFFILLMDQMIVRFSNFVITEF